MLASTIGALGARLDVTVSAGDATGNVAVLDLGDQSQQGHGDGTVANLQLGQGILRIGNGASQTGQLAIAGGLVTGGARSAIILGQDGALGVLSTEQGIPWEIEAGRLVVGDSGSGQVLLSPGGTLLVGHGGGRALILGAQDATGGAQDGSGKLAADGAVITVDGLAQVGEAGQGSLSVTQTQLTTEHGLVIGDAESGQGTVVLNELPGWIPATSLSATRARDRC